MEEELKSGQMALGTKESGRIIKLMVRESFITLMEMSLMGSGQTIKLMDLEFTNM